MFTATTKSKIALIDIDGCLIDDRGELNKDLVNKLKKYPKNTKIMKAASILLL